MRIKSRSAKIATTGILIAIGIILPFATSHGFGIAGTVLLPMHLPVLICGLLCGPWFGLLTGAVLPVINCLLTGMPTLYPMLPIMTAELTVYGLISGLLLHNTPLKKSKFGVYVALISAMIAGRIAYGLTFSVLLLCTPRLKALSVWGAIVTGLPGIVIQLLLVPAIIYAVGGVMKNVDGKAIKSAKNLIKKDKATCVVIRNGEIMNVENGRGIKPLLSLFEKDELQDALVVDKIIGKAAAIVIVKGKAKACYGEVVSVTAVELLKKYGINVEYQTLTSKIINRKGDGPCPMESAVSGVEDLDEGIEKIRLKIEELKSLN